MQYLQKILRIHCYYSRKETIKVKSAKSTNFTKVTNHQGSTPHKEVEEYFETFSQKKKLKTLQPEDVFNISNVDYLNSLLLN